jgi:hypothetical protein
MCTIIRYCSDLGGQSGIANSKSSAQDSNTADIPYSISENSAGFFGIYFLFYFNSSNTGIRTTEMAEEGRGMGRVVPVVEHI